VKISVDKIIPNPQQPRRTFNQIELDELARSIEERGLQVPIVVEDAGNGKYILVSGERRLRAHKQLKLTTINAEVRPLTNHNGLDRLIDATAENVARADMNAVDEARAYQAMLDMGVSVTDIARKCGTSTTNIYGKIKIMKFTEEEQDLMSQGFLPVVKEAIEALLSIPNEADRVKMSRKLAEKKPTGAIVIRACAQYVSAAKETRKQIRKSKSCRNDDTPATEQVRGSELPEWDALYQVGKVPPWKNFTEAVMSTCDSCSLRPAASEGTCGMCPLVVMVQNTLEGVRNAN
jgi:ParB family transcriptional regulator, chromosome partitioning protein